MVKSDSASQAAVGIDLAAFLPDGPWYKRRHLVKLNFCIVSLVLFSSANGYDGSLMNGLQVLDQWNTFFNSPRGSWLGFVNAVYWIGCIVTFPVSAWVSNRFGRKLGIYIGYVFLVLGAALQAASRNATDLIVARLFLGASFGWFGNCVPLLINEIAFPSQRGIANSLFMCGWYIGSTVAACVIFGTRHMASSWAWRIPSLMQLLVPLLALPGLVMAPQSPRWLISVGREEEAHEILTTVHAGGNVESRMLRYELIEITTTIKAEQEAYASASYMDMIRTPGNRKRLLITISLGIFSQWSGNGVVSYYLGLVLDTIGVTRVTDQTAISILLQVWNLIWSVTAALSVDRFGRRKLFLGSAATMLVSYIAVTGLSGAFAETRNPAIGTAVIPSLFIFFAGYDIALTPFVTAYPCEIWPYRLRSRGLAVTWVSAMSAIIFNTWVNPIALESIGWKYYIVFIVVLIIFGLTVYFLYPETRGRTLEQMAVLFDGDSVEAPHPSITSSHLATMEAVTDASKNSEVAFHAEELTHT